MVTRSLQLPAGEESPPYTDLEEGQWYGGAVSAAWAAGLLPEGETRFRPEDAATVEEAADLLTAAAGWLGLEEPEALGAELAEGAAAAQAEAGSGLPAGTLSRGGAASAVAGLLRRAEE